MSEEEPRAKGPTLEDRLKDLEEELEAANLYAVAARQRSREAVRQSVNIAKRAQAAERTVQAQAARISQLESALDLACEILEEEAPDRIDPWRQYLEAETQPKEKAQQPEPPHA